MNWRRITEKKNIEHRTSNIEWEMKKIEKQKEVFSVRQCRFVFHSMLDVGCWTFDVQCSMGGVHL